nr:PREDICTED: mitochondrial inner membrane protein COX18 [Bemisia tabaci]
MSLLKLRTLSSVLHVGHQSFPKYSNLLQNECISPISSTFDSRHLFHSFSISKNDNLLDRTTTSSNIIKRNITTGEKEPFLLASMRFFMESPLVQPVENFIIQFHDSVGLHWWSSIVVMTIGARFLVTSPLYVYQQYIFAKVELIEQLMPPIVEKLKKIANSNVARLGGNAKRAQAYYQRQVGAEWNKLIIKHNCHPFKGSIVLLVQIPLWLYISAALRNIMAAYPADDPAVLTAATEMTLGGPFWCSNLLLPDPTFILPISLALVNLAITEIQVLRRWTGKEPLMKKIGVNAFRLIAILTGPIAAQMPAALAVYWVSSSSFGLVQHLALLSPKVRRFCRVPHVPSEKERPYRHLVEQFNVRWAAMKSNWSSQSL